VEVIDVFDRVMRAVDDFRELPTLDRVDLEMRAVLHQERYTKEKIDLTQIDPVTLEYLCVNYLRHVWFGKYDNFKNRERLNVSDYLQFRYHIAKSIAEKYEWLSPIAFRQYHKKLRELTTKEENVFDRHINEFLREHNFHIPIHLWRWFGAPGAFSKKSWVPHNLEVKVMQEIKLAPSALCQNSRSEYVVYCREWLDSTWSDLKKLMVDL
jgi:hypothetical protein